MCCDLECLGVVLVCKCISIKFGASDLLAAPLVFVLACADAIGDRIGNTWPFSQKWQLVEGVLRGFASNVARLLEGETFEEAVRIPASEDA